MSDLHLLRQRAEPVIKHRKPLWMALMSSARLSRACWAGKHDIQMILDPGRAQKLVEDVAVQISTGKILDTLGIGVHPKLRLLEQTFLTPILTAGAFGLDEDG